MLQKCPAEDDGSVEYAATKVSVHHTHTHTEQKQLHTSS